MEWDKFKMAQKFLKRANAIHPEETGSSEQYNEALALQDVYYDCYMSSFSRADLLKRLEEIIAGKITMPEDDKLDPKIYRAGFLKEAGNILANLESGKEF